MRTLDIPWEGLAASSLLIGGFYPLTQVYQHEADKADNVHTISYLLGYRGTFIFCAAVYSLAMAVMAWFFFSTLQEKSFFILLLFLLPVLLYFFWWFKKVRRDIAAANFQYTMRMNIIASICTNAGFITVLMMNYFE
jgi:1,4-dihydroxy-2-naphthoate polyprenyltransferase